MRHDRTHARAAELIIGNAPGWYRYVLGIALLAASYVVAGRLGFTASAIHPVVSSAWPPSGIALAALLLFGKRFWPGIALGAFVVNITGGEGVRDDASKTSRALLTHSM